ncbi:MAG: cyclic nucleotide-binding domain-containing protein [Spirochaetaceae bacterium]|nr:cyclic nucleotide-binding domain-containing protein [Spirochaetaceae bacterium]
MSKSLLYKTNSVIYFKGDRTSSFYVVKSGKVAITFQDDISSLNDDNSSGDKRTLGVGDFFGVRSALGNLPQDETAMALIPSEIVLLNYGEFEEIIKKHSDITLKLLRNYSKQLSDVHQQIQSYMRQKDERNAVDTETGLYSVGLYFLKNRLYRQSNESFKRYLKAYPAGKYAGDAKAKIEYSQSRIGGNEDAEERFYSKIKGVVAAGSAVISEAESLFNEAKVLFDQKKYAPSILKFGRIVRETDKSFEPYLAQSEYYMSEAFFNLKKYQDVIEHLSAFFPKYPESPLINNALLLMARSYEALNDKKLAVIFYKKLYDLLAEGSPLKTKIGPIIKAYGG